MPSFFSWPDWMPAPQQDSFSIQPEDRRLTSETEAGNIVRHQFDTDMLVADCTLILNKMQSKWFATFERDILRQGTVWFEFPIWEDGTVEREMCRFKTRPKAGSLIGLHTTYTFSLYVSRRSNLYDSCLVEMLACWSPCEAIEISDMISPSILSLRHSTMLPPEIGSKQITYGEQTTNSTSLVQFCPDPNTILKPVVDFMFTETPPASGEKGPANPSTVTGVGSVEITLTGKNLVSLPYHTGAGTFNGITWTVNSDNSVTANGTASTDVNFYFTGRDSTKLRLVENGTYFLSGCPAGGSTSTYYLTAISGSNDTYARCYDTGAGTAYISKSSDVCIVHAVIKQGTTVCSITFRPQLEAWNGKTTFEIIPREEYTISLGDVYYSGSLDVSTGILTVTGGRLTLDGNVSFASSSGFFFENTDTYVCSLYPPNAPAYTSAYSIPSSYICNGLPVVYANNPLNPAIGLVGNSPVIRLSLSKTALGLEDEQDFTTVSAAMKIWLNEHPLDFFYPISTPQAIQIDPVNMRSLAKFGPYDPQINSIYTDQLAVNVGFQTCLHPAGDVQQ